jgi:DNA-binding NtrC family response regulator
MSDLNTEFFNDKETVLLIDDDDMVTDVAAQILNNSGYGVISAKNGKEAIEVYKANQDRIDMAILDMILPDMSGMDTYEKLKEINPGIKVLLASGYGIDSQASNIMERGCDGFIQKPFNMSELIKTIGDILASK